MTAVAAIATACGKSSTSGSSTGSASGTARTGSASTGSASGTIGSSAGSASGATGSASGGSASGATGSASTGSAGSDGVPAAAAAACDAQLHELASQTNRAWLAKEHHINEAAAKRLVREIPEACRDGRWYLAVALLFDVGNRSLEGVTLDGSPAALAAGLGRKWSDGEQELDLLARVTLTSALGREPKLPADACERARAAKPTDPSRAAYVCARAAIAAKDGAAAQRELDAVTAPDSYVDYELARAQAAQLVGDKAAMRKHARAAVKLDERRAWNRFVNSADWLALVGMAKQLAR